MILLQAINISKSYGSYSILSNINIQVQTNERIGLVGRNGTGKSTLLKIIASKTLADSGDIRIAKNINIGYLAQDYQFQTQNTIWNELLSVFSHVIEKEKYLRSLEVQMSNLTNSEQEKEYSNLLSEYSHLTEEFKEEGGYSYESKIRSVLHGLGFSSDDYYNKNINTLSGGQKTRLALAKLLLTEPMLLILDEPTNYLDIDTLTWLENYLKSYPGSVLVVSHDRYFLDSLVSIIYEIENTKSTKYIGSYSQYLDQKAKKFLAMEKQYRKQQSDIKKLEEFVQKNIVRASTTKRAQSRRKQLEKIDKIDSPSTSKNVSFIFNSSKESGNNVLMLSNISASYNEKIIFNNVSFDIYKNERVALIGQNGIGKSTLLKLITGILSSYTGSIKYGSNVKIGYYDQEQNNLNLQKKIIEDLWDDFPSLSEKEIRSTLGNFLFSADDVFKQIKDLSGGERARVSLAKLMLLNANFLILDEPTNHLDTFSREVLENALLEFPGTIMFVSHDRYFLNRISSRTIELTSTGATGFLGNYDYYLEKKAELEEDKIVLTNTRKAISQNPYNDDRERNKILRKLKRKLELLEKDIGNTELLISNLEQELLTPEIYSDYQVAFNKNKEIDLLKEQLELQLYEWEKVQLELED